MATGPTYSVRLRLRFSSPIPSHRIALLRGYTQGRNTGYYLAIHELFQSGKSWSSRLSRR
jgi:hypothetical protein